MVERVEEHVERADLEPLLLPVDARDPGLLAAQLLGRVVAEGRYHFRPDQLDLAEQVRLAGLLLVRNRIAVAGRPALQEVAHPNVRAL